MMSKESIPQEEDPPIEQETDTDESIEEYEDENIVSDDEVDKDEMEPVKEDATD